MIHVRKAVENDRSRIALCIAEGFEKDFSSLCKNTEKVARAIGGGIRTDRFYIAEAGQEIAGVAAVSDCHSRALSIDPAAYKKNFGLIKGMLACMVLKDEFESKLDYPETTGYIEFVAVREKHRRKGVATAMLRETMAIASYETFVLDVTDINSSAILCYRNLGFQEFKRVNEKYGKQKGYNAKIYMKYTPGKDKIGK